MNDSKLKMLTPERIALIILAIVLMVWALILLIGKHNDVPIQSSSPVSVADTVIIGKRVTTNKNDSLTLTSGENKSKGTGKIKDKDKSKSKNKGKKAPPEKPRDHLHEPVNP